MVAQLSPIGGHNLMLVVGVIEIIAGIGVALKPRIFSYVVAAWLVVIIANLPKHVDRISYKESKVFVNVTKEAILRASEHRVPALDSAYHDTRNFDAS